MTAISPACEAVAEIASALTITTVVISFFIVFSSD
jgi:hypothetical protein